MVSLVDVEAQLANLVQSCNALAEVHGGSVEQCYCRHRRAGNWLATWWKDPLFVASANHNAGVALKRLVEKSHSASDGSHVL